MDNYENTRRYLVHGIASAKAKEKDVARRMLERVLNLPASLQMQMDAHYWLAEISEDLGEKRAHLENVLAWDPANHRARRLLAIVDGKLVQEEIIDPDNLPAQDDAERKVSGDRFTCPNCGARMVYSPDGSTLVCEHCDRQEDQSRTEAQEMDFVVGMARSSGHQKAVSMQSFQCQACGAVYLLNPDTLSLTCAHCDSVYSIVKADAREVIPPEGIIPFTVSLEQAFQKAVAWFKSEKITPDFRPEPFKGLYTPVWTFDFGGTIGWKCLIYNSQTEEWEPHSGTKLVYADDLLINASKQLPAPFEQTLTDYDRAGVVAFEGRYTANFLAESYQLVMSDAAIDARAEILEAYKPEISGDLFNNHKNLHLSSIGLIIEGYKLILVPVWLGSYQLKGENYQMVINGQTGLVCAEKPATGFNKFMNWLME